MDGSVDEASNRAHTEAQLRGEQGYLDPTSGLFVMTAAYLLDRGYCCDRGCRHCPYGAAEGVDDTTPTSRDDGTIEENS